MGRLLEIVRVIEWGLNFPELVKLGGRRVVFVIGVAFFHFRLFLLHSLVLGRCTLLATYRLFLRAFLHGLVNNRFFHWLLSALSRGGSLS